MNAGRILLTVFIAYHMTILFVSNLPSDGPTAGIQQLFARYTLMWLYGQATGTSQVWGFFSPEPPRANEYMRVFIEDAGGRPTDVEHDTYGRQRYPYLWYDHLRKVNRRLASESRYQRGYAAWVCREWERTHDGQPAARVRLVRLSTRIPPPVEAVRTRGWDPARLPLIEKEAGNYACADLPEGQLPPYLRRRFGLSPREVGAFKRAELQTWWDARSSRRGLGPDRSPHDDEPLE
jgi:hypothetical protein